MKMRRDPLFDKMLDFVSKSPHNLVNGDEHQSET